MKIVTGYPDNMFSWTDLATTDGAGAIAFYGGLFGWTAMDVGEEGAPYGFFQLDGHNVCGFSQMSAEQAAVSPPVWSSYVKNDDVDAVAAKVEAAGGKVIMQPMDVFTSGRMAFIQAPGGEMFGVWQPRDHIGASVCNQPNSWVWNELQTRDAEGAKAFYASVLDWDYMIDPSGYVMAAMGERPHAGIMQMDENWDASVPNNWQAYFMVEDVNASTAKAKELGATILVDSMSAGEMGSFSVVQDPQGAVFTIMQFSNPVDAPPGH